MALPVQIMPYQNEELVTRTSDGQVWPIYQKRVRRARQAMPIDRPLPYSMRLLNVMDFESGENLYGPQITHPETFLSQLLVDADIRAYNRCYDKVVEKVRQGKQVQVGMNLATAGMTASLLANTRVRVSKVVSVAGMVKLLDQFAVYLRKGQHRRAVKLLGKRMPPSLQKDLDRRRRAGNFRDRARDISQEYLMFHFAWSPLLGDMWNALEFLRESYTENPYPVEERATKRVKRFRRTELPYKYSYNQPDRVESGEGRVTVTIALQAQVTNVPLFVLNRMGLVNPAIVAWDLVPFSFVAAWFANFEQMLAAPTDFVGVDVKNISVSHYTRTDVKLDDSQWSYQTNQYRRFRQNGNFTSLERTTPSSLAFPSFIAAVPITGWRRALAQISLLTLFGINPGDKALKRARLS